MDQKLSISFFLLYNELEKTSNSIICLHKNNLPRASLINNKHKKINK